MCHHVFQGQFQVWALFKGWTAAAVVHTVLGVQRGCKLLLLMEKTTTTQWFRRRMASWSEIQIRYVWKLTLTSEVLGQPSSLAKVGDGCVTWMHSTIAGLAEVIKSGTAPSAQLTQA